MRRLRTDLLPLVSLVWSSPVSLVCGGHDCVPVIFQLAQDQTITAPTKLERAGPEAEEQSESATAGVAAMKMFQSRDRTGEVGSTRGSYRLASTHQKQITELRLVSPSLSSSSSSSPALISSSGADGRICVWECPSSGPNQLPVDQHMSRLQL